MADETSSQDSNESTTTPSQNTTTDTTDNSSDSSNKGAKKMADSKVNVVSDYVNADTALGNTLEGDDLKGVETAKAQAASDAAYRNENPYAPVFRAANPDVGGESF
jgi:hypothetical protein